MYSCVLYPLWKDSALLTEVQRSVPGPIVEHSWLLASLQVKSRVAVLNQRHPERTIWKESAICIKTWNSSVLQLIDVSIQALCLWLHLLYNCIGCLGSSLL